MVFCHSSWCKLLMLLMSWLLNKNPALVQQLINERHEQTQYLCKKKVFFSFSTKTWLRYWPVPTFFSLSLLFFSLLGKQNSRPIFESLRVFGKFKVHLRFRAAVFDQTPKTSALPHYHNLCSQSDTVELNSFVERNWNGWSFVLLLYYSQTFNYGLVRLYTNLCTI